MNKMFMTPVGGSIKEIELYEDKEWELEDSNWESHWESHWESITNTYSDYCLYKNHSTNLANKLKLEFIGLFNPNVSEL